MDEDVQHPCLLCSLGQIIELLGAPLVRTEAYVVLKFKEIYVQLDHILSY